MCISLRAVFILAVTVTATITQVTPSQAAGQIDAETLVSTPHGPPEGFNGVRYMRHEAVFEGVSSNNRPYRVPCQIIAPRHHGDGNGLLLFDWLVPSTIGQEQVDARYTMTDDFLFGLGHSYATVRCNP